MKTLFLIFFITILAVTNGEKQNRRKWCHINEYAFKCNAGLRVFTSRENGTGIVINERSYRYFCDFRLKLYPECTTKWLEKCGGNDFWMQIGEALLITPVKERFADMCSGPKYDKFLRHSPCLHWKVKLSKSYRENCVRNIQAGFEYIEQKFYNATYYNKLRSICCVYNRWEKCITSHLLENCGPVSDEIIVDLIRAGSYDLMFQLCSMDIYHPNSRTCTDVWQPEDMVPKGLKSNSLNSYMFSYWCPNVGYGIVPERDT